MAYFQLIDTVCFSFQANRQNAINLINVKETVITDTYLMYQTYPQKSPDSQLTYQIVSPPTSGVLLLSSSGLDLSSGMPPTSSARKLRLGSTFSQVDLLAGHLKYRLTTLSSKSSLDDSFTFRVSTKEDQVTYCKYCVSIATIICLFVVSMRFFRYNCIFCRQY
jgi:hypothetical protein